MWTYPIGLVLFFYRESIIQDKRHKYDLASIARATGLISKDLGEKGVDAVNKMWDSIFKYLDTTSLTEQSSSRTRKKNTKPSQVAEAVVTHPKAKADTANVMLSAFGDVQMIKKSS